MTSLTNLAKGLYSSDLDVCIRGYTRAFTQFGKVWYLSMSFCYKKNVWTFYTPHNTLVTITVYEYFSKVRFLSVFVESSLGLSVDLFQVDFAKVLHYVGAGVAFPTSMLFVCLQAVLTYRLAKTQEEYWMGHLRAGMALLALITLVLSILCVKWISIQCFNLLGVEGLVFRAKQSTSNTFKMLTFHWPLHFIQFVFTASTNPCNGLTIQNFSPFIVLSPFI